MKIHILNTGGTIGMAGEPLKPAKSATELLEGIKISGDAEHTLEDFPLQEDSTNWKITDRVRMAECIEKAYEDHDAFVVMTGTDTIAETAATFCMIFKESLQKPLVVVGAQMAKDEEGTDAIKQISDSLRAARLFVKKECVGVFSVSVGEVWDASRLKKKNESAPDYLHTPGRGPMAHVYPHVRLEPGIRKRDPRVFVQGLRLEKRFNPNVVTLCPDADMPPWILSQILRGPNGETLAGIILEAKGAGNIPDRIWDEKEGTSLIDSIKIATNARVVVGILSPFDDGYVDLTRYALGQKAAAAGAISLGNLTPAMAKIKLSQAIAMYPGKPEMIQTYISTDIIGELLPGVNI